MSRSQPFFLKLLSSSWFIGLEVVLLGSLLVSLAKQINRGYELRKERTELDANLARERVRQQELQSLISRLQSPTVQEKKIREHLGLQRPGEKIVVIEEASGAGPGTEKASTAKNSWRQWRDYFLE